MNLRSLIASGSRVGKRFCATSVSPATEAMQREVYKTLSKLSGPVGTVAQTLNQYVMEGNIVRKENLFRCAKDLRKLSRHQHALEIFDWIEMKNMKFTVADHAVRLDLIAKTKGLKAAEDYFNGLDSSTKNHQSVYGSLMNCYCVGLKEKKAKAYFTKMDERKLLSNSLPFSNMMSMYMRLGQPEKVPELVDAMKLKGISPCLITYSIWMQSCGRLNDFDGLAKIIDEMGQDSTWSIYATLASIYTKAGLYEKAELALKSVEEKMNPNSRTAQHFLISLYAGISKGDEVYRAWESLKNARPEVNNMSYLVMIQALSKLGDIDGVKKIFTGWESKCLAYDMKLVNIVVKMYLEGNMYEEAEKVLDTAMKKCKGPFWKARELLMIHLLEKSEADLAMKHLKAAVLTNPKDEWRWSSELVSLFFLHFEKAKDVDGAEELCRVFSKWRPLNSKTVTLLTKVYAAAEKTCPDMRDRLSKSVSSNPTL